MNANKIDLTIPTTPAELAGLFFTVGQFSDQLRTAVGASEEACVIICVTINASPSLEFRAVESKRLGSAIDYVRKVAHGNHPFRLSDSKGLLSIVAVDAEVESERAATRKASANEREALKNAAQAEQAAKLADYDRLLVEIMEANAIIQNLQVQLESEIAAHAEANATTNTLQVQLESEIAAHAVTRASMTVTSVKRTRSAA